MIQKSITTTPFDIAYHGISVVSMGSSWVVLRSPQIAGGGVSQSIDALVEILDQHLQTWSTDELLTGKIGCSALLGQWNPVVVQSWYGSHGNPTGDDGYQP